MSATGNTPDPPAAGGEKTRLTNSPEWSQPTAPPPTESAPAAPTANSPYGPGNEPPGPETLPPSLQGRYKLIRTLGQGGFATVYLAYDSVLDQQVAIKVLRLGLASRNDRERFLLEARIGAKLRHPNIVTVFDIIQTSDGLQMVMEYYPGGTLTERLRAKGPLHPRTAIDYTRQVAQALAYAHRHNVIHRDVKPANIFLSGEGMVKLGDFGIATNSDTHEFTQTGMIIGTPLYMPPEQSADSRDVDPRTDIYALGLTLYHMLTGRPPRVVDLEAIPEVFRRLIKQATAHDRNERLVSAEQFIAMLDQMQAPAGSSRPAGAAGGAWGDNPSSSSSGFSQTFAPGDSYPGLGPSTGAQDTLLPTPTTQPAIPAKPVPPAATTPPPRLSAREAQEQATQTQMQSPAPVPARPAPVPPPPRPRRSRGWVWLGGAALAAAGFAGYLFINAGGGSDFLAKKTSAPPPTPTATSAPTPASTATPAPTATPPPPGKKGPFKGEAERKMQNIQEDVRKQMDARREAQLTPTQTPTPTATPTPALDDMTRFDQAYAQCLETHPGVKNALEIIQEKGGQEMPPQMRQFALKQAQTTLLDTLKKNPEDPVLNLIAGNMFMKAGNSQLAQGCFERAIQSDRRAGSPLGLSMEKIQKILAHNPLQGQR